MNILTIPFRNMRRRLGRTVLLGSVFTIGVLAVVALNYVAGAVGESFEKKLSRFGANIVVQPRADTLAVSYGGLQLGSLAFDVKYLDESDVLSRIRSIDLKERISAVAPKLLALGRSESGAAVGVIGVVFPEEERIKTYWAVDGSLPGRPDEVLAGRTAADRLGLSAGSTVRVGGKSFVVSGVLAATGAEDDNVLFADLHALQEATDKRGLVNYVEVAALCSGCPIDEMVMHIAHAVPDVEVKALSQVVKQRMYSIAFVDKLAWAVSLVILLTACVMIALSLYASVGERKKEIGLLRSLGYRRASVFAIFCFEALLLGLSAAALGYLGGYAISFEILHVLDIADDVVLRFEPVHFILTFGVVALLTVASSALPAWKASRVEPSEAFNLV